MRVKGMVHTRNVATITRITFSLAAACATEISRGMMSNFLQVMLGDHCYDREIITYLLIWAATSCSNVKSQKQNMT